jgi:Caspase domain
LPPKVAITIPANAKLALSTDTLEVHAVATSFGAYPVTALRLLLDGRPVPKGLETFPNPRLGEARGSWTVALPPGRHRLIVQANSEVSNGLSEPVDVARTCGGAEPARGTLYVLAIGINDYPDKLKLDCAAPDANYLRRAFLDDSWPLFRDVEARLLLDGQATRAEIFKEVRRLSAVAKAGDVAVVFYAGHGVYAGQGDRKIIRQFYLVPVDVNLRDLGHSGISGEDLRKEIGDLPCTTVLILDVCKADSINNLLREMVYESRVVIMCGAGKDQFAVEENGHGYFTRAIVEGMGGEAESNQDGQVGLRELQTYVHQRVLKLSEGKQEPTILIPSIVGSFPLSQPKRAESHSTP